jgi:hypothetical protein
MSEVKVNKISPRSGTTVTLGDSGDTFTIPSGATINNQGTATNFGATGSASWNTTVKTGDFTAVAGEGYFVNTTSGAVDVTLPAGTAGAVIAIKDYAGTFDTNAVTLVRNGSDKIGGVAVDATLTTEGIAVTLVFIDSTQGWLVTDDGLQSVADTNPFIIATGGTITCSGNDRIHTFTGPGTFSVSKIASCAANNLVSYMVVAGGGSGGNQIAGGAGAGGFREVKSPTTPYTASPLDGYPSAPNRITVTATSFPIVVGGGGAQITPPCGTGPVGNDGSVSTFSTITSAGGGGGGGNDGSNGRSGGSGGGAGLRSPSSSPGAGNTPPTTPAQGFAGGTANPGSPNPDGGGGGGGATTVGANASPSVAGPGGTGATTSINGTPTGYAGGGGGGGRVDQSVPGGTGGTGGGGAGAPGQPSNPDTRTGSAGTANTGGGGGGAGYNGGGPTGKGISGAGGSGIVIIRYKIQ